MKPYLLWTFGIVIGIAVNVSKTPWLIVGLLILTAVSSLIIASIDKSLRENKFYHQFYLDIRKELNL